MATLYQRKESAVWWCWGYDRTGKRWLRTTKQKDKRAAAVAARAIEMEIAASANPAKDKAEAKQGKLTLEDAIQLMMDAAERAARSPETIEFLLTKSRHLVRLLGASLRCAEITLATTVRYSDQRLAEGASRHTIHKEIRTLIQALRRAQKLGQLSGSSDPRSLMPDELKGSYVPRERWLTHEDLDQLLAQLAPERRDYVTVLAWTGVRSGELFKLVGSDFDAGKSELHVRGTKTKKSDRRIPLAPAALEIIARRAEVVGRNEPLFPMWHTIGRDLDLATLRIEKLLNPGWARKAGNPRGKAVKGEAPQRGKEGRPASKKERQHPPIRFPTCSPNDLRRTFASWLAASGVPIQHAMDLMGHTSLTMLTTVYARLAPTSLHAAIGTMAAHRTVTAPVATSARKPTLPATSRARKISKKPRKS